MTGRQWHQPDHMHIICTSLQTDNNASTSPLRFYKPDALPAGRPTNSVKALKAYNNINNNKKNHYTDRHGAIFHNLTRPHPIRPIPWAEPKLSLSDAHDKFSKHFSHFHWTDSGGSGF